MVINRRMEVGVSHPLGVVSLGPSMGPPTATRRNLAELFDVDMDQLTGNSFFVASDGPPCGRVEVPKSGHSKPAEHPPHRGNHQSEMTSDPSRPPPPVDPQSDNPSFDTLGKPVRCRIWCRPPVDETALTVGQACDQGTRALSGRASELCR